MPRKLLKKVTLLKPPIVETSQSVNRLWLRKANSMKEGAVVETARVKVPRRMNNKAIY